MEPPKDSVVLSNLDEFIASSKYVPRGDRSKLFPFEAQINEALAKRLSYKEIAEWLRSNGIDITTQGLSVWVNRRRIRLEAAASGSSEVVRPRPRRENAAVWAAMKINAPGPLRQVSSPLQETDKGAVKMTLEEYRRSVKPKRSAFKLLPWLPDILALRKDGYTFLEIVDYLNSNDVSATPSGLNQFLKRQSARDSSAASP